MHGEYNVKFDECVSMENWWNDADRAVPQYLEKRLSQCCFDQDWPGIEPRPPW
jgi:hypothetical protein